MEEGLNAAGGSLDLVVGLLTKEYLSWDERVRKDQGPTSYTEQISGVNGPESRVDLDLPSATRRSMRLTKGASKSSERIQTAPHCFQYHCFMVVYKDDGVLSEPRGCRRWDFFTRLLPRFHHPTHPPLERELHLFRGVPVPRTVLGILNSLRKYLLKGLNKYHVCLSPKSSPKWEAGFGEKENASRSKLESLSMAPVFIRLLSVLTILRGMRSLAPPCSPRELALTWPVTQQQHP